MCFVYQSAEPKRECSHNLVLGVPEHGISTVKRERPTTLLDDMPGFSQCTMLRRARGHGIRHGACSSVGSDVHMQPHLTCVTPDLPYELPLHTLCKANAWLASAICKIYRGMSLSQNSEVHVLPYTHTHTPRCGFQNVGAVCKHSHGGLSHVIPTSSHVMEAARGSVLEFKRKSE